MTPETFLSKFGMLADAPNGVKKFRELVLQLAVMGKLVPQDPNEDAADSLLAELIKFKKSNPLGGRAGRSKQSENGLRASSESEQSFPITWARTTIGSVVHVIRGSSPRPKGDPRYFAVDRTPYHWVKISDIRKHSSNGLLIDTDEFLTEAGMQRSVLLPKGTLVLTNSATIGVPIVLGIPGCCIHDGYLAFPNFPHEYLDQKFLQYVFHSMKQHAIANARGLAQLNLNTDLVRSFSFGLPPLAEQKRIVAKVDQLMALCDELEKRQEEKRTVRVQLNAACLGTLTAAQEPAPFTHAWNRVRDHFDLLYDNPQNVTKLRETILQLAVMGKLVPQDPNDEPAEELLTKLHHEKSSSTANGKRRLANRQVEQTDWRSFPSSWRAICLADAIAASSKISYGVLVPGPDVPGGVPFVRIQDLSIHDHDDIPSKHIFPDVERKYARTRLQGGEILLAVVGSIGKVRVAPLSWKGANIARAVCRIHVSPILDRDFVTLVVRAPVTQRYFLNTTRTLAQPTLNVGDVERTIVPIPPLAEQKRIVAKVDQLIALCDELEARLTQSQSDGENLLAAVVAELTAPDGREGP